MNNKSIKTHFDLNVFLTFLVLLLCGLGLFAFKMNGTVDCSNVGFDIIANSYTTEDLIEFRSNDASGVQWEWDFGADAAKAYRSDVLHRFQEEGTYTVSLKMNGQCVATKEIVIGKRKKLIDPELIPNIILPQYVRVGQEVVFSNDSDFATSWQWSFGETMAIDGDDRVETYTFTRPGEKTILLVVNDDRRHEAKQRITVLPALKEKKNRASVSRVDPIETVLRQQIDEKPVAQVENEAKVKEEKASEEAKRIKISSSEMQQLLMDYSNRSIDDLAIRNYFCYSNIPVFNASGQRFTVSQFFNEVRDVNKVELNSIKMIKDEKTGCVKSMTVDMRTKKGLFWKTF